jgi:hypothetical protein
MRNAIRVAVAVFIGAVASCGSDEEGTGTNDLGMAGTAGGGTGGAGGSAGTSAGAGGLGGGWEPVAGVGGASGMNGAAGMQVSGGNSGSAGTAMPTGGTGESGASGEGGAMAGTSGGTAGTGGPTGPGCLQGSGDYLGMGPYTTGKMDITIGSMGPYTLFYPTQLEADCKHPIVAWGNGTGVSDGGTYGFYQEHAASWGMVVVASHESNCGSGEWHKAGLDYMLAENDNPMSMFYGKLSTRAGTSGHSQGGMGANAGSSHPNVEAIANVQGAFGTAPAGKAFLCLTGTEDIAIEGCKGAVNGTSSPALYANYEGATHTGTATLLGFISNDPGTKQYMRFYTAWFRCFLADDEAACDLFKGGASCPVCGESGWAEIFANNY